MVSCQISNLNLRVRFPLSAPPPRANVGGKMDAQLGDLNPINYYEVIKMYVCPICKREYDNEDAVVKCYMKCWRESNTQHHSKSAPKSEDITTREVSADIEAFFNSFRR